MTVPVPLRPAEDCRFDLVVLGEVMLRLDPGEGRVRTTRSFRVSEGGGEYNVGRALRRCFDRRVALVSAIGDNEIGRLLEDLLLQGGTNLDHVVWKPTDEVGRSHRNPLNFTERGFGVRAANGTYDRAHSATGALEPDDVDWDHLFGTVGARWFHTGGIFAGLSASTAEVTRSAMAAARRHGTIVSYDINYRPSLWADRGGSRAADAAARELLVDVDVLFGVSAEDFEHEVERLLDEPDPPAIIAAARRTVHSASINDWGGVAWSEPTGAVEGRRFDRLEILDRVGGGDGFAAGMVAGLLDGRSLSASLELGIAHGALVMTTPGDTSAVSVADVERVVAGGLPSVDR